jgi:uncharacterized RmlC-like cupin family protein
MTTSAETAHDQAVPDEALHDEAVHDEAVHDEAVHDEAVRDEAVRDDMGRLMVRPAQDVDALPWEPLPGETGVSAKVLWRSGDVAVGLVRVDAGAQKRAHTHFSAHHHIWVVSGAATMVGRSLTAGAYVYVPPGVEHAVTDVGPEGVVFFYTYRPVEVRRGDHGLAGFITPTG